MKKLALTAWLLLLCACVPKTEPPTLKAEGLLAMSLPEMAAALHVGDVSSATLVAGYVNRIDAIDRAGPELRAVLSVNPLVAGCPKIFIVSFLLDLFSTISFSLFSR